MYKIMATITRTPGLSRDTFLHRWQDEHPAYVRRMPHIRRYRQNVAIEHKTTWPADGVAELWFDSVKDIAESFSSSAADQLREHEKTFIGELSWMITEETEVSLDGDNND